MTHAVAAAALSFDDICERLESAYVERSKAGDDAACIVISGCIHKLRTLAREVVHA